MINETSSITDVDGHEMHVMEGDVAVLNDVPDRDTMRENEIKQKQFAVGVSSSSSFSSILSVFSVLLLTIIIIVRGNSFPPSVPSFFLSFSFSVCE